MTFTVGAILPEILCRVHSAPSFGVLQRAVERSAQRGSLLDAELIIEHDDFSLGAVRRVGGRIEHEPTVLQLHLSTCMS